jgi:hypothetical protein
MREWKALPSGLIQERRTEEDEGEDGENDGVAAVLLGVVAALPKAAVLDIPCPSEAGDPYPDNGEANNRGIVLGL